MAKINGLDIPPGLNTQYYSALSLFLTASGYDTRKRKASVSYAKRISLANNSLFVKWQNLYNDFLEPRKTSWRVYWIDLPFGTHSGANGWPGSGYSAFIHVNAPRYMAGLELLLDPPSALGPELLINGDFSAGADNWYDYGGAGGYVITTGQTTFTDEGDLYYANIAQDNIGEFEIASFLLKITLKIPTGVTGDLLTNQGDAGPFIIAGGIISPSGNEYFSGDGVTSGDGTTQIIERTLNYANDIGECGFIFGISGNPYNGNAIVYNVSLKEILTP